MSTSRQALQAQIDAAVDEGLDASVAEIVRLCRQPSVSAQNLGIEETANMVAEMLLERGMETRVISQAGGYPIVYGEAPGLSDRALLFYNHYDVQPAEPLDLWETPPFEPTFRDGKLFARGASDDKGHIVCRLAALDALRAAHGDFPCRVKFLIEGEEEIGSPHLHSFIAANRDLLAADGCLWESGGVNEQERPEIYFGMRGILYVQFSVRTLDHDAHSGAGGSIMPNAAWRLVWALASLKDADERVLIPGFYDDIALPSALDLDMLARIPDDEAVLRQTYGVERFLKGRSGPDLRRERVFRPTANICGLTAGYQGPSSKTVLPALASAKFDFRLVPDQDPHDIYAKLRRHLDAAGFEDVETELLSAEHPARVDLNHPFCRLAIATAEDVYGQPAVVWPMVGGSGPMYPFVHTLKLPIVTPGVGYTHAHIHAPNENIRVKDFARGTKFTARLIDRFVSA